MTIFFKMNGGLPPLFPQPHYWQFIHRNSTKISRIKKTARQNLSYGTRTQLTKPSYKKKWARQNLSYGAVRVHKSQFLSSEKKVQQNLFVHNWCAPKINVGLNIGINFADRRTERFLSYVKFNVGISWIDRGNFVRHRCAPKIDIGLNVGINFADRKTERFFSYVKINVGIIGTDRGNGWNG